MDSTKTPHHRLSACRGTTRAAGVLLCALLASGCFRYVPADARSTPPGEGVRVLLTRQGAAEFTAVTNLDEAVSRLDGEVVATEGNDLLLEVPVGQRQDGFTATNINQTIRVPMSEILSFERRELDAGATALLVGGTVGFAALVIAYIMDAHRGDDDPPPPPVDDLRLDLGWISIGIGR